MFPACGIAFQGIILKVKAKDDNNFSGLIWDFCFFGSGNSAQCILISPSSGGNAWMCEVIFDPLETL